MVNSSAPGAVGVTPFVYRHRVTYSDCTAGNHVYYSRYLDLLEAARGAFFRKLGASFLEFQERDTVFPVVECHLKYRQPAPYDEMLLIELWVALASGVRLNFGYRIVNPQGTVILEGETWHACATVGGKPRRLPETLVALLQPYLKSA